jgi:hypothetical protein
MPRRFRKRRWAGRSAVGRSLDFLIPVSLAIAILTSLIFIIKVRRRDPAERERRRRTLVNQQGRMIDGMLTDVNESYVYFQYSVSGVAYQTSQDLAALGSLVPPDLERCIGPVTLKYMTNNPFNSIVLSEEWSGFKTAATRLPALPRKDQIDHA